MKLSNVISILCALLIAGACTEPADPVVPGNNKPTKPSTPKQRNLYISPDGSDSNNGLASVFPFQTFDKVLEVMKPGDIINIMPGVYETNGKPLMELKPVHSGEEGSYITFKAHDPNNKPVFFGKGKVWNTVKVQASYLIFDGIEFKGNNQQIDSAAAYARAEWHHLNRDAENKDWGETSQYNTNGFSVEGEEGKYIAKHVIIRNCIVHDFPGGGIGGSNCDYYTIENNIIYNNAWYTMYACSGISIIHPANSDAETGHKLIVQGNKCFNNMTKIPWYRSDMEGYFKYSDGNGIIIDINNRTYPGGPYAARTLVRNNVCVDNGGSGIHSYCGDHVDIINNTAHGNGKKYKDGEYADIYGHSCQDVNIVNNIMYSRDGGYCNRAGDASKKIIYENNLCFGGKVFKDESYFKNGETDKDPLFVHLSTDITKADFHLKEGSPAIGMGTPKPYMPDTDIEGNPRDPNEIVVGAYTYSK